MRLRIMAITLVLGLAVVGCGAPTSSRFTPIDRGRIPAPLTATTTTTSTVAETTTTLGAASTTTAAEAPPTTIVNELVRLYFIAGRDQLVGIDVPLARPVSVAQVMAVLEAGPTGAGAQGLRSALPLDAQSTTTQDRGVVTVDLMADFFTEIDARDQRLAVGQIVLTLTQLGGISQATFTQDRQPIAVVLSDGSLGEVGQVLYAEDYDVLLDDNALPPPPSTSTTTTSVPQPPSTLPPTTLPPTTLPPVPSATGG